MFVGLPSRVEAFCTRSSRKSTALILLVGIIWGRNIGEINKNDIRVNPYKRMTLPSTQNLKLLDLWVFFLICCSTFSFLPNVGHRLTLEYLKIEYLTISPSSESFSSTLIHSPSSISILKPEYITHDPSLVSSFTHLYGTRFPETSI